MTHRHLLTLADVATGSIVRLSGKWDGLWRACQMTARDETRWCRRLRDDRSETNDIDWPSVHEPVLEILVGQEAYRTGDVSGEVDPLQARTR